MTGWYGSQSYSLCCSYFWNDMKYSGICGKNKILTVLMKTDSGTSKRGVAAFLWTTGIGANKMNFNL